MAREHICLSAVLLERSQISTISNKRHGGVGYFLTCDAAPLKLISKHEPKCLSIDVVNIDGLIHVPEDR